MTPFLTKVYRTITALAFLGILLFFPHFRVTVFSQSLPPQEECLILLREVKERTGTPGEEVSCTSAAKFNNPSSCALCLQEYIKQGNPALDGYSRFEETVFLISPNMESQVSSIRPFDPIHQPYTFHGYPALLSQNESTYTFEWVDTERHLQFSLIKFGYEVRSNEWSDLVHDIRGIADAFYAVANEKLTERENSIPPEIIPPAEPHPIPLEEQNSPINPAEIDPEPPQNPQSGQPESNENLPGLPSGILIGSLTIPILGALAGAAVSTLTSLFSTGASAAAATPRPNPTATTPDGQELYWSERPWDEAGPGYVTKAEYEQTQQMLAQGFRWTKDGWQSPQQMQQNLEWQQKNHLAVEQQEAEWHAHHQAETDALNQQRAELEQQAKELEEIQTQVNLYDFRKELETINQSLRDQNIYVANPLQGDPTLIMDGISKTAFILWDNTVGWITNSQRMTCGDYVIETLGKVKQVVNERFGDSAKAEGVIFEEKSTRNPQNILDWFDKINDDNHNLIKVTLPDGSEWAVDFHQHNDSYNPKPLLRPWEQARKEWMDYLGKEFSERVNVK